MSFSSSSRSSTPTKPASKGSAVTMFGTDDFRFEVLEPNNILLEDGIMSRERWSHLAFSLGMPARETQKLNTEGQKFVQRLRKKKGLSTSQCFDALKPFVESIIKSCPDASQRHRVNYHNDAVPTDDAIKNTIHRLPTPKPTMSIGYHQDIFKQHHQELQNGIILGPYGQPCDLNHISQPIPGHCWPFLIVEISDQSLSAAQHANAITAATCNNALSLLSSAVVIEDGLPSGNPYIFDPKFGKTFSLSVHGKTALLSVHSAQGLAPYVSSVVSSYKLDDETDVASLADRLRSIMVWARYNRLGEIIAALDALDKRVHGFVAMDSEHDYDFDPSTLKHLKAQGVRRPDRIKVALKAGLPKWMGKAY